MPKTNPISLEIGEIVDYALMMGELPTPDEHFPCITLPFNGVVSFTSATSKTTRGMMTWAAEQRGNQLGVQMQTRNMPTIAAVLNLDDTGALIDFHVSPPTLGMSENEHLTLVREALSPVLISLAFLHAKKGVEVTDAAPVSRQVRRARERKGQPVYTYKVLTVPSVTRVIERTREYEALGVRAHLVRGHWADYRDTGVFGNPNAKGIYWKAPHIRGDRNLGIVDKDYAVAV